MEPRLDISPLEKALAQLNDALDYAAEARAEKDMRRYAVFRTAVIQSFEYCYELCLRIIKRYLEIHAPIDQKADELHFRDFIRTAAEAGIIGNPAEWIEFRKHRNATSHTYSEAKAEEIMQIIQRFMTRCRAIADILNERTRAT